MNSNHKNNFRKFTENWNIKYPLDRWYRKRYNIPFGSDQHKSIDIQNIRIEFEEDLLFNELLVNSTSSNKYDPGKGLWLNKVEQPEVTQEEITDIYDNLNIKNIQTNEDGSILI